MSITVSIREATGETGYLLTVTRQYQHAAGGQVFPGPKCSSLRTAKDVAAWIEAHIQ